MRLFIFSLLFISSFTIAQTFDVRDDFEGNGTIFTWFGDDCNMHTNLTNPEIQGINQSSTVLEYHDLGGQYANVAFTLSENLNLSENYEFSFKVYVPSEHITGNQNNQVSLKLQDASLNEPWTTQTEIIKNIVLDQWQELTFNFSTDAFINLDANSPDPINRNDLNRIMIQINGENNNDQVKAYIDDFNYDGWIGSCSIYNKLVWSDEFDTDGAIDDSKWHHQTLLPNGQSWYNNEIQHYTDRTENSYVQDGHLHIVAKKETFTDQGVTKNYTSARLNSKFAFTNGRIEVKAKLPEGPGTWPAIWMLGKNITEPGGYYYEEFGTTGWPDCGEIDIMEHWGVNQNYTSSALHTPSSYGNTQNHEGMYGNDVSNTFHVYAAEWTPTEIRFYYDNFHVYTYAPDPQNMDTWPFIADQYILLNIAINGDIENSFDQSPMVIDYVRVYQEQGDEFSIDVQSACESFDWIDGNTYTESTNTPTYVFTDEYGCESNVQLDLTIGNVNAQIDLSDDVNLVASPAGLEYQWLDCNNDLAPIPNANESTYQGTPGGSYAVIVTDETCSDTSQCYELETLELPADTQGLINIYPNPTTGLLNITLNGDKNNDQIRMMSVQGKEVLSQKLTDDVTVLDLSSYNKGVYILEIVNDKKSTFHRIIKK